MRIKITTCGMNILTIDEQSQFINLYPYLWGSMRTVVILVIFLVSTLGLCRCKKGGGAPKPVDTTVTPKDTPIYKGADVSWVTQMEDSGFKFYDSAGAQMEGMQLLKSLG